MTPQDLLAIYTRPKFPGETDFTYVRVANFDPQGAVEVGDLISVYGYPTCVSERVRSGGRGVPDRFIAHAWLPAALADAELLAGRFTAEVKPSTTKGPGQQRRDKAHAADDETAYDQD